MRVPGVTRDSARHGARHRWAIVAAAFLLLLGSFGTQSCFGLFLKPLTEQFGWSRAAASGAMSLAMAVSGLVGVFMGRATDRWGARVAVAPGVAFGALGYLLTSRMGSLWEFYLLFGVGGGVLAGCTYPPAITAVSTWFGPRQRTLAIGVALLGPIVGQMVLSPVLARIIAGSGWRTAWWVLAIVALVTGVPALGLLDRKRPEGGGVREAADGGARDSSSPAAGLSTRETAKTAAFWILMFSGAAIGLSFYAFTAHIVSYATDLGLSSESAALILTVSSVGGGLGTLLAWAVAGRVGHKWALLLLTLLDGVATFLFMPAGSIWAFYLLGILLGLAFSGAVPVRMAIISILFGTRAVGTIVGLASLWFSIGAIAGPFLAGAIYDSTGNYDLAFLIIGIVLAVAAASLYFLRSPRPGVVAEGAAAVGRPA
jgi:MFS transporter, OFA family, oxalate/formate antiporter